MRFFVKKKFGEKNFWSKRIFNKNVSVEKKFWCKKLCYKIFLLKKNFQSKKNSVKKIFRLTLWRGFMTPPPENIRVKIVLNCC